MTVGDLADVTPPGRTKRVYLQGESGRPMLSGAQLLQTSPIHLQKVLPESLGKPEQYALRAGQIAYQADGRSEESLGIPVIVTADRDGWLASEHIGRIEPSQPTDAGWLFAALRTKHCLLQIKASATGSVIDETSAANMKAVVVPRPDPEIGTRVFDSWKMLCEAARLEEQASRLLDNAVSAYPAA